MSAVNFLFRMFLILLFTGCTQKPAPQVKSPSFGGSGEGIPHSHLSYMGTAERGLHLEFAIEKSTISTIRARISLPFNYDHKLVYKWKLGQGVTLENEDSESLRGELNSLKGGVPQELAIRVKNFDEKKKFIRFEIIGTDPEKRIFTDGLVSSDQEKSFETIVQEVEKINGNK